MPGPLIPWLMSLRRGPAPFAMPADLTAGLVVTLTCPTLGRQAHWEVRGRGANVTLRLQADGSGRFDQQTTRFGLHLRERWASALPWPGDRGGIETVLRLSRLPPKPMAGLRWQAEGCETLRAFSEQGALGWEETRPVMVSMTAGAPGFLRLGGAKLAVLPLEGAIERDEGITHLRWQWFPAAGFGLPTGEGQGQGRTDWQLTKIAPLAPPSRRQDGPHPA